MEKIERLENLQKCALKVIDNKLHQGLNVNQLLTIYGLQTLKDQRKAHHLVLMYRLKDDASYLETYRPGIGLRNNNKIEFKVNTTK